MNQNQIETLHAYVRGQVFTPGDMDYSKYSMSWNLLARQYPAVIVVPQAAADIVVAVRFANENNLGIGVMATGHGVGSPCNGGLLINTSLMRGVTIDPVRRVAKVEAGALWKDVIGMASGYGLATLAGSAPHVGVVGYTLGGGFGYLGRKFGLHAASVVSADVVTAAGDHVHTSEHENQELFESMLGGGGNFGVVTSLEFRLYPLENVFGGAVFFETGHGREALHRFSQWAGTIPDEITAAFAFVNVPDIPAAPPPLRGRSLVTIKGCYCGDDLAKGAELFAPMRKMFTPVADTFGIIPVSAMDTISKDPVDPMGILQYAAMLKELSTEAMDALVSVAGEKSSSPLLMFELRRLGGALDRSGGVRMLGAGTAAYSLNMLGGAFHADMTERVQAHLANVKRVVAPFTTGEVFLNFLEADPSADRVRAAYTSDDWTRMTDRKKKYDPTNIFRFNRNISG